MDTAPMDTALTARQQREIDYHREHAHVHRDLAERPVSLDVVRNPRRRWWNAYWTVYTLLRGLDLKGKRVLIPGCGAGHDAIRVASLGAEVWSFDISPEMVDLARRAAAFHPEAKISFDIKPAEKLDYPGNFFDAVLFVDILHHVHIPAAMAEIRRALKPGAWIVGDELYTHSWMQRVRESRFVSGFIYPRMKRFIYRGEPYITADEHKIDEAEFQIVRNALSNGGDVRYFGLLSGRLFPGRYAVLERLDRLAIALFGGLGRYLAGRVVFSGRLAK